MKARVVEKQTRIEVFKIFNIPENVSWNDIVRKKDSICKAIVLAAEHFEVELI